MQTVYWRRSRELEAEVFAKAAKECEAVCAVLEKAGHAALGGLPPGKNPVFSDAKVEFQGVPGVEPFIVRRVSLGREREGKVSEFCKTHGMPYECAIIACLFVMQRHFGEQFSFSVDDKSVQIWSMATNAVSETLGWSPS